MNEQVLNRIAGMLNTEQVSAIEHIVAGWRAPSGAVRVTIVDGPPGTGKTHVAAVTAGEWVRTRQTQVVVLTPTHKAAERVQQMLMSVGFERDEVMRLRPGRFGENYPGVLSFNRAESLPPNVIRRLRQASVLVTTWHGSQRALGSSGFSIASSNSLLLLDEVSQIPFQAFLAVLRRVHSSLGGKGLGAIALLGDPHQLPVVTTQDVLATNAALGILRRHPECTPHQLVSQYRMNQPICELVNKVRRLAFGGNPLRPATDAVAQRTLEASAISGRAFVDPFDQILDPSTPVTIVDTSRFTLDRGWFEQPSGSSWVFEQEAQLAARIGEALRQTYGPTVELTALSPYKPQVAALRANQVGNPLTIYKAQGQEWDCVILSLARTRILTRTILDDVYQHIYVGLSRPRAKLVLLIHVDEFRKLRLFGPLLQESLDMPGVRWVKADPLWVEQ